MSADDYPHFDPTLFALPVDLHGVSTSDFVNPECFEVLSDIRSTYAEQLKPLGIYFHFPIQRDRDRRIRIAICSIVFETQGFPQEKGRIYSFGANVAICAKEQDLQMASGDFKSNLAKNLYIPGYIEEFAMLARLIQRTMPDPYADPLSACFVAFQSPAYVPLLEIAREIHIVKVALKEDAKRTCTDPGSFDSVDSGLANLERKYGESWESAQFPVFASVPRPEDIPVEFENASVKLGRLVHVLKTLRTSELSFQTPINYAPPHVLMMFDKLEECYQKLEEVYSYQSIENIRRSIMQLRASCGPEMQEQAFLGQVFTPEFVSQHAARSTEAERFVETVKNLKHARELPQVIVDNMRAAYVRWDSMDGPEQQDVREMLEQYFTQAAIYDAILSAPGRFRKVAQAYTKCRNLWKFKDPRDFPEGMETLDVTSPSSWHTANMHNEKVQRLAFYPQWFFAANTRTSGSFMKEPRMVENPDTDEVTLEHTHYKHSYLLRPLAQDQQQVIRLVPFLENPNLSFRFPGWKLHEEAFMEFSGQMIETMNNVFRERYQRDYMHEGKVIKGQFDEVYFATFIIYAWSEFFGPTSTSHGFGGMTNKDVEVLFFQPNVQLKYVSSRTFQPVEKGGQITFQIDPTDSLEQFVRFPFRINGIPIQPGVLSMLPSNEQKSAAIDILKHLNAAELQDFKAYQKRGRAMTQEELTEKRRNTLSEPTNDPGAWLTED